MTSREMYRKRRGSLDVTSPTSANPSYKKSHRRTLSWGLYEIRKVALSTSGIEPLPSSQQLENGSNSHEDRNNRNNRRNVWGRLAIILSCTSCCQKREEQASLSNPHVGLPGGSYLYGVGAALVAGLSYVALGVTNSALVVSVPGPVPGTAYSQFNTPCQQHPYRAGEPQMPEQMCNVTAADVQELSDVVAQP